MMAKLTNQFSSNHKIVRYLIELSVLVNPKQGQKFTIEQYKYLFSLIKNILNIYEISDRLHYRIFDDCNIQVDNQYLIDTIFEESSKNSTRMFSQFLSKKKFENKPREIKFQNIIEDINIFRKEVDSAFLKDIGFSFGDLIAVLDFLSFWPDYFPEKGSSYYQSSSLDAITQLGIIEITDINKETISTVIDYLTLKQSDILRTLESDSSDDKIVYKNHDEIPIWEYSKRFSRYTIRPIIKIKDTYYWGTGSVTKCKEIWQGSISRQCLPYSIPGKNISNLLKKYEDIVKKVLVSKSFSIISSYTEYSFQECELYKVDKIGNHPRDLGDYDIIAFLKNQNILLNFECKYIRDSFCMKDAKRDMEKIFFGKDRNGKSYISALSRRQEYLEKNYEPLLRRLKWIPQEKATNLKIIPIFLLKDQTSWTFNPPIETNIIFLEIDQLREFLDQL